MRLTLIALLIAFGISRTATAQESEAATRQAAVARGFQNQKLYSQAVEEWETFLKKFPKDPRVDKAQHYLGTCALQDKQFTKAIDAFQIVVTKHPKFELMDETLLNLGISWYGVAQKSEKAVDYAKAEASWTLMISKYPKSKYLASALSYQGESLYQQGKAVPAAAAYERLCALRTNLPPLALYMAALTALDTRQYEKAKQHSATFLIMYPQDKLISKVQLVLRTAEKHSDSRNDSEQVKPKTFEEVKSAAEGGDKDAQFRLGEWYRVTFRDYDEAARWHSEAAKQGHISAQKMLSIMYRFGRGVRRNGPEAVKWCRKAAEQGDAHAQANLGNIYEFGVAAELFSFGKVADVPKDASEAAKWYRKAIKSLRTAAEQGDAEAHAKLGYMYANGIGVPENYAEAMMWYRKAAEQGNADAQLYLGRMHLFGKGVPKNNVEAAKWYRKAAEQGDAIAQYNLGQMYHYGTGVPKDDVEAYAWLSVADENGYGENYRDPDGYRSTLRASLPQPSTPTLTANSGGKGLAVGRPVFFDAERLKTRLMPNELAAAEKLATALAKKCTPKHDTEDVKWILAAAEQGYILAQCKLGVIYLRGNGVPQDYVEAYAWFSVAATNGNEEAREAFPEAKAKLTPEQLAEGQKRATELFEQINANKVK